MARVLTPEDVHNIRAALVLGYSASMLARLYGVTVNTIRWVRDGLTFKGRRIPVARDHEAPGLPLVPDRGLRPETSGTPASAH